MPIRARKRRIRGRARTRWQPLGLSKILLLAEIAKKAGFSTLYLPEPNIEQTSLVEGIDLINMGSLKDVYLHLKQETTLTPCLRAAANRQPHTAEGTPHL